MNSACKFTTFEFSSNFHKLNQLRQEKLPPIVGTKFNLNNRERPKVQKQSLMHSSSLKSQSTVLNPSTEIYIAEDSDAPNFILAGPSHLNSLPAQYEWKNIMEPAVLYRVNRPSTHSISSSEGLEMVQKMTRTITLSSPASILPLLTLRSMSKCTQDV